MFGTFQQSCLRIEVEASAERIRDSLVTPSSIQTWLWPQTFSGSVPPVLDPDVCFTTAVGPVTVHHQVASISEQQLCLLLSHGIDGVHAWTWGDGWIQSCLEGVSLLPLSIGHTLALNQLKAFLSAAESSSK